MWRGRNPEADAGRGLVIVQQGLSYEKTQPCRNGTNTIPSPAMASGFFFFNTHEPTPSSPRQRPSPFPSLRLDLVKNTKIKQHPPTRLQLSCALLIRGSDLPGDLLSLWLLAKTLFLSQVSEPHHGLSEPLSPVILYFAKKGRKMRFFFLLAFVNPFLFETPTKRVFVNWSLKSASLQSILPFYARRISLACYAVLLCEPFTCPVTRCIITALRHQQSFLS